MKASLEGSKGNRGSEGLEDSEGLEGSEGIEGSELRNRRIILRTSRT